WSRIASPQTIFDPYIFVYDLNGKKPLLDIAISVKKPGQKIVLLSNDILASVKKAYKGVDIFVKSAGIEEFISLLKYSDKVITDSFHGVAMSIIFEKSFYSFI